MLVLDPDFQSRLDKGADVFEHLMSINGKIFREMNGRRTVRFELHGKRYFIKCHSGVGWKELCKNLLQMKWPVTGANQEWCGIKRLKELGISTMTLVAYGTQGLSPVSRRSFVVTEELANTQSLEELFENWNKSERPTDIVLSQRVLIRRVAEIARTLHANGINHRDFYLCHFLLDSSPDGVYSDIEQASIYLIDLHRMAIRKSVSERDLVKDIAALYFSSMDAGLSQRDMYRFLRVYYNMPLREVLRVYNAHVQKIQARARSLYVKFHGQEPSLKY